MKASKEIRDYINRNRKRLKAVSWDDLMIIIKMQTCKKWFKRDKKINWKDYEN